MYKFDKEFQILYVRKLYSSKIEAGEFAQFLVTKLPGVGPSFGFRVSEEWTDQDKEFYDSVVKIFNIEENTIDMDFVMANKENFEIETASKLFKSIKIGDLDKLEEIVQSGFNVNLPHPRHGLYPIHLVANGGGRILVRTFMKAQNIDFLVQTPEGELPSDLARFYCRDKAIWRYFRMHENAQRRTFQ